MHVLVVGGTRFLGYELTWRLVAEGHRITLFNRGTAADPFGPAVERLRGDRTTADFRRLLSGRRFDAAVDFAAYTGADVEAAVSVLRSHVGRYVFISTGQVYLVREGCPTPASEADYDGPLLACPEDALDRSQWDYGIGKRAGEDVLARAFAESAFPGTRLRLPMVHGPRDHYRRLESYLWRILDGGPLLLPGSDRLPIRHVYSGDVVHAIASMLGKEAVFGRAFNLCQTETLPLSDFLATLADVVGAPLRLAPAPIADVVAAGLEPRDVSPLSGRWMSLIDPARAQADLGFRHRPVRQYLETIVAAFLAHPPSSPPPGYARRAVELAVARRQSG